MEQLQNIRERNVLSSLARSKSRDYESKTVHPKTLEDYLPKGWTEGKPNLKSVRLTRPKSTGLSSEISWTLMYKLGFPLFVW